MQTVADDGLSATPTRAEVRARFGEPVWQQEASDRFEVGPDYLQLEYDDDRVRLVVAAIGERDS
ncbi:hypothetical protein [Nocardioides sp. J54]|uniref:hypothetical protein n=1 Tax=Nocardioides sp. J54 TaxID=935866 RepID=UPI00048A7DE5|nr:hypothetical protein [Nocardioides sp. J54]